MDPPSSAEKKTCERMAKSSLWHLPVFCFPRKKARTFILTFEKLSEPSENTLYKAENELTSSCVYGCCG